MQLKADQIKAVLFPQPNTQPTSALEIWRSMTGSDPDSFQRPGPTTVGASQAGGTIDGYAILVESQIARIDLSISAPMPDQMMTSPPQIESWVAALDKAVSYSQRLASHMVVNRVALVVQLSMHCQSNEEANDNLSRHIGVNFPEGSTDRVYQFNDASSFSFLPHVVMNRIHTWSTGVKQLMGFSNAGGADFMPVPSINIPVVALRLDYNSLQGPDVAKHAPAMLGEIRDRIVSGL